MRYEEGRQYRIVDAESAGIAGCAQNGDVLTADTVEDCGARAFCAGTYFGDPEDLKQGWIVPVEDENEPMAEPVPHLMLWDRIVERAPVAKIGSADEVGGIQSAATAAVEAAEYADAVLAERRKRFGGGS